ncbi:MAG: hypothetical protein Q8N26_10635 [Myxococcales bacterium]|nr:hypothetical protein [Myxococcales bacterium]
MFFSASDLKAALAAASWFGGGPIKTAYGFSEIKLGHPFPFPPNREVGPRITQAAGLPTEEPLETWELRLPSGKHVEIISIPPGDAPVEMREAWVGLRLPVVDDASAGVVLVDRENALSQLFARSPPASMFFRMRPEPAWGTGALISLPAEICRISGAP